MPAIGVSLIIISLLISKVLRAAAGESVITIPGERLLGLFSYSIILLIAITGLIFGIIGLVRMSRDKSRLTRKRNIVMPGKGHSITSIIINAFMVIFVAFFWGIVIGLLALIIDIYFSMKIYRNPTLAWKSYAITGIISNAVLFFLGIVMLFSLLYL